MITIKLQLSLSRSGNWQLHKSTCLNLTPDRCKGNRVTTAQASRYLRYPESLALPFCLNRHGGYIAVSSQAKIFAQVSPSILYYTRGFELLSASVCCVDSVYPFNCYITRCGYWDLKETLTNQT